MRGLALLLMLAGCAGAVDADGDGFSVAEDCDDEDASVFPGAAERCDGVDHDCNGTAGVGLSYGPNVPEYFADEDDDGFGGTSLGQACEPIPGGTQDGSDCDDAQPAIRPDADEVCDGLDNDCDELVDDADTLDPAITPVWYLDVDGDGYGSAAGVTWACTQPAGYVADATDCDDSAEGADRNPGAPEICDGKDNNCDVATGLLVDEDDPAIDLSQVPFWYRDRDGDGQGDILTAIQTCVAPAGHVDNGIDCDDRDANNFVGNPEVCDGRDNDCDGLVDGESWWDLAWPYRILVGVDAPPQDTTAPPVAIDLDFGQALAQLGDLSAFDPASIRVVIQDCASGSVALPYDFIDGSANLLSGGDAVSPVGDEAGALAFRYDTDGDLSTQEVFAGGSSVTVGVYFGSAGAGPTVTAPSWASPLMVAAGGPFPGQPQIDVETGGADLLLDGATGGVVASLAATGGVSTGGQVASQFGNGVYFGPAGGGPTGGWVRASSAVATTLQVVHQGPVVAIARAVGSASNTHGGFEWEYRYIAFAGRPEVYAKVSYELDRLSHVGPQGSFWTAAVRPWQTDNLTVVAGAGDGDRDAAGFRYAWGTYAGDARGLWLAWRVPAAEIGAPIYSADGRYVGLSGQDHDPSPVGNEVDLPAGTRLVDGSVIMALPFEGPLADWQDEALGLQTGVDVTALPVEPRP
jgi:hypothetical protein